MSTATQVQYHDFLSSKRSTVGDGGVPITPDVLNSALFPFQRAVTAWAVRKGRAAIFADTGLGKTLMQIEWARVLGERTLIVAPLSVARQTVKEAKKIGVDVHSTRHESDLSDGINITNYEMLDHFTPETFGAVVLDESSILKSLSGKTRQQLTAMFAHTKYRLCCTATPAPNDYIELGNHADFLGICTQAEMLSMFFINANKQQTVVVNDRSYEVKGSNSGGQEWRLKHHAEDRFFEWLASWAISLTKPSDIGFEDDGFVLPPLTVTPHFIPTDYKREGELFTGKLQGIADRSAARKHTMMPRLERLKMLVNGNIDQWIVWVGLDAEGNAATAAIEGAMQVKGSDTPERKAQAFEDFQDGKFRVLVSKIAIAGYGMNFQCAHRMAFFGMNDSWEGFYQGVRREWRYLQPSPVDVHLILSDAEEPIYTNVMRKHALAQRLRDKLVATVRRYEMEELERTITAHQPYLSNEAHGDGWEIKLGDSCERLRELADNSVDLSVYSPPFVDLFTYSNSDRDLGNSRGAAQFFQHYDFIIREVLRVTKPGRLTCVHTSDIPAMLSRDGYIGVKDFPGDVIRAHEAGGWIFVGRAFVQKNPQAQAIRIKSKALLFVQLRKDSSDSRPALIDQVLLFRKSGDNAAPVTPVVNGELDNETWIEWAHGIWLGISESDTLNYQKARAQDDEKHICPLQLGTIERCVKLYSNPGEVVLSPFAGIGSEGYVALKHRRRFIGIELKESYWALAAENCQMAVRQHDQLLPFMLKADISSLNGGNANGRGLVSVESEMSGAGLEAGGNDGAEWVDE